MRRVSGTRIVDTSWGKMCVYTGGDGVSQTLEHPPGVGTFWDGPVRLPFYDKYSDPTALAVEIGAFCGEGMLYLASRNRRVLAMEPYHWAVTEGTAKANALKNVTILRGAAFSENCWMTPASDKDQEHEVAGLAPGELEEPGGIAFVRATATEAAEVDCVQAVKLDSWLDPNERVCLIKSDAQGCDLRAMIGLKQTIEKWRPAVLFEFEERLAGLQGDTWGAYERFWNAMGYEVTQQSAIGYPHDFVAVSR